jgi:hypothetical protein
MFTKYVSIFMMMIIQFNSVFLCAASTAKTQITDTVKNRRLRNFNLNH